MRRGRARGGRDLLGGERRVARARRRARARRLVVGKRPPRCARQERPRRGGRHGGARAARGDGVRRAGAATTCACRWSVVALRPLARSTSRRCSSFRRGRAPPQGAIVSAIVTVEQPRGPDTASTSARGSGARASTSCCAPTPGARSGGAAGSAASPTGCARGSSARIAPRDVGRAARGPRRRRARRRPGRVGRPARPVPRVRALPPARGIRGERRARRRRRADARVAARGAAAGWARSPRWPGSPRTFWPSGRSRRCIRAGVVGALGSLAWLAARQRDRWHVLLLGCDRPPRVESVHAARRGLSAVVRRGGRNLRRREAAPSNPRGLPVAAASSRETSPSPRSAARRRRRCSGSSSTRSRCWPCPRMRWPRRRCRRCSALALLARSSTRSRRGVAALSPGSQAGVAAVARAVRADRRLASVRAGELRPGGLGARSRCARSAAYAWRRWLELKPVYLIAGSDRPKIAHRGRAAPRPVRGRTASRFWPPASVRADDAVAACNALGPVRRRAAARDRRGRRGLEGRRRQDRRRVSEEPGAGDRPRARRRPR